jgi:hypothetical protein
VANPECKINFALRRNYDKIDNDLEEVEGDDEKFDQWETSKQN